MDSKVRSNTYLWKPQGSTRWINQVGERHESDVMHQQHKWYSPTKTRVRGKRRQNDKKCMFGFQPYSLKHGSCGHIHCRFAYLAPIYLGVGAANDRIAFDCGGFCSDAWRKVKFQRFLWERKNDCWSQFERPALFPPAPQWCYSHPEDFEWGAMGQDRDVTDVNDSYPWCQRRLAQRACSTSAFMMKMAPEVWRERRPAEPAGLQPPQDS